jgi:hypothetical protein
MFKAAILGPALAIMCNGRYTLDVIDMRCPHGAQARFRAESE